MAWPVARAGLWPYRPVPSAYGAPEATKTRMVRGLNRHSTRYSPARAPIHLPPT
jgi:hypothetical protein